jgi:hypothetical protein
MTQLDFGYVFGSALDTFKAFDNLTVENSSGDGAGISNQHLADPQSFDCLGRRTS